MSGADGYHEETAVKAMLGWGFQFGTGGGEGASCVDVWGPTAAERTVFQTDGNSKGDQGRGTFWVWSEEAQGCHGAKAVTEQRPWGRGHKDRAGHSGTLALTLGEKRRFGA